MEYTVQKLSRLAGISTRTLRYYDEFGILKPTRINSSGYRIYGKAEVDRLQQILFYRELGMSLDSIKLIVTASDFDELQALRDHREKLMEKRIQLDLLITNVNKSIATMEGSVKMTDQEKFEGFKRKMIEDNEVKFGSEIRAKYGEATVEQSNRKFMNLTAQEYAQMQSLSTKIQETLKKAFATRDPAGELGQKVADMHRQWLSYTWGSYSKEAHAGLAQMYVDDQRFTAYYDQEQPGLARFLRDAIFVYTGMNQS